MATGDFTITYDTTSVTLNQFSGEDLPRAYLGQATLEFSAIGAGYSTGPAVRQKRVWSIAAYATYQQCLDTFTIFEGWDAERATGVNTAKVSVQDELFGSTVSASAFFTDPPVVSKLGSGNDTLYLMTFALTET
jgi:hypothetical protein